VAPDSATVKKAFVDFLKPRIKLMHKNLSSGGMFVLHVDSIASHYCKVMMDEIFDIKNFHALQSYRYQKLEFQRY
jgi:adenine specific DNA methylase Mod